MHHEEKSPWKIIKKLREPKNPAHASWIIDGEKK
jgi:hypothetical protein